jgi:hypothetical protein
MDVAGENFEDVEIPLDGLPDIGTLHLGCDDTSPFAQDRPVNLAEGGCGHGSFLENAKSFFQRTLEAFFHHLSHLGKFHGSHLIAKLSQLPDEGLRQKVRPQAHDLTELDESGAKLFQGAADSFGGALVGLFLMDFSDEVFSGKVEAVHKVFEPVLQKDNNDVLEPCKIGYGLYFHREFPSTSASKINRVYLKRGESAISIRLLLPCQRWDRTNRNGRQRGFYFPIGPSSIGNGRNVSGFIKEFNRKWLWGALSAQLVREDCN